MTTRAYILHLVRTVVSGHLYVNAGDITESSSLDDLGADQRDVTDIISELEEELAVELSSDTEDARTVADLVNMIIAAVHSREQTS